METVAQPDESSYDWPIVNPWMESRLAAGVEP